MLLEQASGAVEEVVEEALLLVAVPCPPHAVMASASRDFLLEQGERTRRIQIRWSLHQNHSTDVRPKTLDKTSQVKIRGQRN